jgi:hypothetical protein
VMRVRDLEDQLAFWACALDYVPREPATADYGILEDPEETDFVWQIRAPHAN